ncbi:hypothetical protein ACW9HP_15985 [Nocardia gipuzkoensis]
MVSIEKSNPRDRGKFVVRAQLPLGWFGSERVLPNSAPFVRGLFG